MMLGMVGFATIQTWGEMIRFSHSVFALPFALMAAFLAGRHRPTGLPAAGQLALIVLCMVAARSFAMTFNRITDAAIDARNPRTATRHLPTGRISVRQVWTFLILAGAVFMAGCWGFLAVYGNAWPARLALPTLVMLALYSYSKRWTVLAHFCLGAAIAFSPVAAWIAVHPESLGLAALALAGAVVFWIAGFDIIYACQDIEVDRRDGLFSIPASFGVARALQAARACHVVTVGLLVSLGLTADLGWLYWTALAVAALLLAAEHGVVKPDDLSRINLAFFALNGCISLLLGAATVVQIILSLRAR